ncbi:MAG: hypothetical protein ACXADH_16900 [Candidatus Kariarchaeaceae archaeon]|jgi:hypothetical protein
MSIGNLQFGGTVKTRFIKGTRKAPLIWKLKNNLKWDYIKSWIANTFIAPFANKFGIATMKSELRAVKIFGDGRRVDYGVVCRRLVTTAFVEFMVDQLQADTTEWGDFKYHDSGVGITGAAVGDTDIETTDGEARATGSQIEGATAEIYKSVGTITYTTTKAITEHGLFSKATGTTLMDRHTFAAINVENTDQIEFTYELTVNDGG